MSESQQCGTREEPSLTCPRCDDPLYAYEEWLLIKPWKRGEVTEGSIQDDYAHERCADAADKIALHGPDTARSEGGQ